MPRDSSAATNQCKEFYFVLWVDVAAFPELWMSWLNQVRETKYQKDTVIPNVKTRFQLV